MPIGWLYATYHLLREPETAVDIISHRSFLKLIDFLEVLFDGMTLIVPRRFFFWNILHYYFRQIPEKLPYYYASSWIFFAEDGWEVDPISNKVPTKKIQNLNGQGILGVIPLLGFPRKLLSMVSKWVISPTNTWDIWGLKPTYILTLDPNFRPGTSSY